MEYKDDDGNILYGYSTIDLQANTDAVKLHTKVIEKQTRVLWVYAIIFGLTLLFVIGLVIYIDYHNILTHVVDACIR